MPSEETPFQPRLTRKGRRAALTMMLGAEAGNDIGSNAILALYPAFQEVHGAISESEFKAAAEVVTALLNELEDVDEKVQEISPRWRVSRMAPVDRNILRLGVFELTRFSPTAVRQTIVDYVQLGREFGEKSTHAFINGLLDQLCKNYNIAVK